MGRPSIKWAVAVAGALAVSTVVMTTSSPVSATPEVTTTDVTCTAWSTPGGQTSGTPYQAEPSEPGEQPLPGGVNTYNNVDITLDAPDSINQGDPYSVAIDIDGITNGPVTFQDTSNDVWTTVNVTQSTVASDEIFTHPGADGSVAFGPLVYPTMTHGLASSGAAVGQVDVSFDSWKLYNFQAGILVDCVTATPATTSITIIAPPSGPVATDDTGPSLFPNVSTSFGILENDFDPNDPPGTVFSCAGDPSTIDESSVVLDTSLTQGTAVWNATTCQVDYTAPGTPGSDTFTYTVDDDGGLTSNSATVTVTIGNPGCTAPCVLGDLDQTLLQNVIGGDLSMTEAGAEVQMSDITLDGTTKASTGAINRITVIDNRGNPAAGWVLNVQLADDIVRQGSGGANPSDVIEKNKLSSVTNTCAVTDGEDAVVTSGATGDFGGVITICSTLGPESGGTFTADVDLELIVPASANAGVYQGTLQFTLA